MTKPNIDFCKPRYRSLLAALILTPILSLTAAQVYTIGVVMTERAEKAEKKRANDARRAQEYERTCSTCAAECSVHVKAGLDLKSVEYTANAIANLGTCIDQCAGFHCE